MTVDAWCSKFVKGCYGEAAANAKGPNQGREVEEPFKSAYELRDTLGHGGW